MLKFGSDRMLCIDHFKKNLARLTPHRRFIVAYSGGIDSHALLHLMSQVPCDSLQAVYVNHGLSEHADYWQAHCARVCDLLTIPYKACHIRIVKKPRHSLEAMARELRYELLASMVDKNTVLLTGHNQNDQAETVLLQLMRGAGIKGLSAMPEIKPFHSGWQARPLLRVTRAEIEVYASEHGLQWIEDDSNSQTYFDRNFLRHDVVPKLEKRRQGVVQNIARSAAHVAEAFELIHDLGMMDYERVKGISLNSLSIKSLKELSNVRQSNVIRYWLSLQIPSLQPPSQAVLAQLKQQLLYSYAGSNPLVHYHDCFFRRKEGDIELSRSDC